MCHAQLLTISTNSFFVGVFHFSGRVPYLGVVRTLTNSPPTHTHLHVLITHRQSGAPMPSPLPVTTIATLKWLMVTYLSKSVKKFVAKTCALSNLYPLPVLTAASASSLVENSRKKYLVGRREGGRREGKG